MLAAFAAFPAPRRWRRSIRRSLPAVLQEPHRTEFFRKPVRLRDPPSVPNDGALPLTDREPIMDLNYLYHRHGVSLLMAERAACEQARSAHRDFAHVYAERIADWLRQARPVVA